MTKPPAQIVGLKTISLNGQAASMNHTNVGIRPNMKRVFTEDEYKYLLTLPTDDLKERIGKGDTIIALLTRPEMLNMTPKSANMISSNLKFQQDEIRKIIKGRNAH